MIKTDDKGFQTIFAIDPGPKLSAYVVIDTTGRIIEMDKIPNRAVTRAMVEGFDGPVLMAIEKPSNMGNYVGDDVFDTAIWIGRFIEAGEVYGFSDSLALIKRHEVKQFLLGRQKGVNDSVIRSELINRYGPGRERAIGTKSKRGPLYGVRADIWQALALAITAGRIKIQHGDTDADSEQW